MRFPVTGSSGLRALASALGLLAAAACSGASTSAGPSASTSLPSTAMAPTVKSAPTTALAAVLSTCTNDQLQGQLRGIQGATGNLVAVFWFVDTSTRPCMLRSPATMKLLNSAGEVQLSATTNISPIPLSAATTMPMPMKNPTGSEHLADVALIWPTDVNAALAAGSTSGKCPTADFVPSAARISFSDSSVTVTDLRSSTFQVAVCGSRISIGAGPLGAS